MGIPNATKQASANAVANLGNWISAHTGAGGGTTGANEATGGGYSRRQVTGGAVNGWTSSGTGTCTGSTVNLPVAAGTYVEGGIWSAASGGTFVGSDPFAGGSIIVSGTGASIDCTPSITA